VREAWTERSRCSRPVFKKAEAIEVLVGYSLLCALLLCFQLKRFDCVRILVAI
jgi:hypothetical protein